MSSSKPVIYLKSSLLQRPVAGTPSQRAGLYYERKVLSWFDERFLCVPQLIIQVGRARFRPDIIAFDRASARATVIEVKHQFCWNAQRQVDRYAGLLRSVYPWLSVNTLIVCEQVPTLEPGIVLLSDVSSMFSLPLTSTYVFPLSSRRLRVSSVMGGSPDGSKLAGILTPTAVRSARLDRYTLRCGGGLLGVAAKA